jgi:hypothetical protein
MEKLLEALKPFAEFAEKCKAEEWSDPDEVKITYLAYGGSRQLTLGDCLRAKEAVDEANH